MANEVQRRLQGGPLQPKDLDVVRDLMDVQLLMKSDVDPALVQYTI